jgi:hypothetical protein
MVPPRSLQNRGAAGPRSDYRSNDHRLVAARVVADEDRARSLFLWGNRETPNWTWTRRRDERLESSMHVVELRLLNSCEL